MSYTISYFFNYSKDLAETGADINECLGCSLAPYQGDPQDLFVKFLGIEFSLRIVKYYENDGELDFENFKYELGFRTAMGAAGVRPIQLPAMATIIYVLHRRLGIAGLLVHEMQILLARYEEREVPNWGQGAL